MKPASIDRHFSVNTLVGDTHPCAIYLFIVVSFKFTTAKHARPVPLRPRVQLGPYRSEVF